MSFRDSLAISVTPLLLRLVLGITFVWAGAAKVLESMPVQGEQAAALANMGVLTPSGPSAAASPVTESPTPSSDTPAAKPDADPVANPGPPPLMQTGSSASTPPAPKYTASDFPEPIKVKQLYMLAASLHSAAYPGVDENGKEKMALWPPNAARGSWPVILAWAVTLTELVGGFFCLVGLFTRLSALGLAGVMLGAMWLAVIGPAIQSGKTRLGFLPTYPTFGMEWQALFWQFALFMCALGVFFSGPGALAIDCLLFPRSMPVKKPKAVVIAPANPA